MFESAVGEGWRVPRCLDYSKGGACYIPYYYVLLFVLYLVYFRSFHISLNCVFNVFVTPEGSCVFFYSPEKNARGVLTVVTEQQLG